MIKRIISGLLSAVMGTVLVTTDFGTANHLSDSKISKAEKTLINNNVSINATNSLGNYISDAMQQKEKPQKMSFQCISDYNYDVGFAEFDIETKKLQMHSSQPSDAKVSVIFKNEDNDSVVYTAEYDVKQGKDILSNYDVAVTELPEFFTVDIMLFDSFYTPVCEPYTITTYTRFVQEMKATDIYDYEEELVVNLDEDETTNFIVLSEDTVKGETTEDTNILVSADYENDQYVFEYIDDTIRYLSKGDHFFIRPTENDIIALSVGDITIDGDRATLTGDENVEGIFDVIKIETSSDDVSNSDIDEESEPENLVYNDIVEDEYGELAYDSNFRKSYSNEDEKMGFRHTETTFKFSNEDDQDDAEDFLNRIDFKKPDFSVKELPEVVKTKIDPSLGITGEFTYTSDFEYQFYQKWLHVDFDIKWSPSITINIGVEGAVEVPITCLPIGFSPVPGLWLGVKPELKFSFEGALKYKNTIGLNILISFDTSRKKKLSKNATPFADAIDELSVEGKFAMSFNLQPMIYFISESVASLTISIPIELGAEISGNDLTLNRANRSNTSPQTVLLPEDMIYDEDTFHTCKLCFEIKPYLSVEGSLVFKLLKVPFFDDISLSLVKEKILTTDDDDEEGCRCHHLFEKLYCSVTHRYEFGLGECPYQAYKTTFDLFDLLYNKDVDAEISVDGLKVKIDGNNCFVDFYCENGTHDYTVSVDGEEVKRGSFKIDDAVKEIKISLDEDEEIFEGEKRKKVEPQKTIAVLDYNEEIPERSSETTYIESGRLGDKISYFIYPNGEMNIHGSGEMYANAPSIANISKVTTVYFIDNSPENGEYITSICNGLFKGAEKLETVYLSNEITKIGKEAFNGCKSLKYFRYGGENDKTETFVLPSKLEVIGEKAFSGCTSVDFGDLVFNSNVNAIGANAFNNCINITSITVENENVVIESDAFYNCINTKELTLASFEWARESSLGIGGIIGTNYGNEYSYISNYDLRVPNALKTINIKGGTIIPYRAFYGMSKLEKITLPKTITTIENEAFRDCTNAVFDGKRLIQNVETIGEYAFSGCENAVFGDLTFSDTTKTIGFGAFRFCYGIKSLVIPETIDKVEACAFGYCSGIKSITIESENTEFTGAGSHGLKQTFFDCNSLETIQYPITSSSDPDKNYNIGSLFQNGSGYVIIPDSLKTIIITNGKEINYNTFNGFENKNITKVVLPDTIEIIGDDSFSQFKNLEEIIMPKNLTEIGIRAFQNCTSLEEIIIPKNVTKIGWCAFQYCESLKRVYFHDNIKRIVESAFQYCKEIEEVNYEGSSEQWDEIIIEKWNEPVLSQNGKVNFNVPAPTEVPTDEEWVTGDANGDGEVDMSDIVLIMQALANPNKYGVDGSDPTHITVNGFKYADADGNGLTLDDALHIQLYLLGKISSLV